MNRRETAGRRRLPWITVLALALCGVAPASAGDFNCADPGDLDPGRTDVTVTKTADVTEVESGDEVTFTISVHNCGPVAALGVEFTDLLPLRVTVFSVTQLSGPTAELTLPLLGRKLFDRNPVWGGEIKVLPVDETAVFEVVVLVDYL
ncbi:MAG: hypothetical protein AAGF23_13095 [Acidobacteriota bacterium]